MIVQAKQMIHNQKYHPRIQYSSPCLILIENDTINISILIGLEITVAPVDFNSIMNLYFLVASPLSKSADYGWFQLHEVLRIVLSLLINK